MFDRSFLYFSSVQFSRTVVSDSLQHHESQHAGPPCPSPTPRVYPNPCPSSWWCHPAISSSVIPFSSCPQSFPALGSFPLSQLFTWGGHSDQKDHNNLDYLLATSKQVHTDISKQGHRVSGLCLFFHPLSGCIMSSLQFPFWVKQCFLVVCTLI